MKGTLIRPRLSSGLAESTSLLIRDLRRRSRTGLGPTPFCLPLYLLPQG